MSNNPLFTSASIPDDTPSANAAVELIRSKVAEAYSDEPDAAKQIAEAAVERTPSKHQRYMLELSSSGKSLAEIQTAWHHYYTTLSDAEKHEVWQEFYAANQNTPYQKLFQKQQAAASRQALHVAEPVRTPAVAQPKVSETGVYVADHAPAAKPKKQGKVSKLTDKNDNVRQLKRKITHKVSAGGKLKAKHHIQSLLFGLGTGAIVLAILLFSFFNEYVIAPFIQPSRTVSASPIIVGDNQTDSNAPPSVIVPKINIQIPVDFTVTSNDENVIQNALEGGVVHYPNTVNPGQNGNAAYFGHSSQNIFNNGKYKFAFVLLHQITTGDVFYITYNGTVYAYEVFAKEVVPPTQVSVLTDTKGRQATAVLITCDPPGFNTNRLVVWGEQISPSPAANSVAAAPAVETPPTQLSSNGPTLWGRLTDSITFWN